MLLPRRALLAACSTPGVLASPAVAQEAVDLLLVLAMDASGSIDEDEFRLQREGYAEALTHPQVIAAIRSKRHGATAIAILEWGSPRNSEGGGSERIVDWHRVSNAASAQALADALLAARRSRQSYNAIGDALDHAGRLLREAPFAAEQHVIDLSGDGPDLRSLRRAPEVRDELVGRGVMINALAVAASGMVTRFGQSLEETYRREVIGGPGAFVITAESRRDIARALRAKLVREMA